MTEPTKEKTKAITKLMTTAEAREILRSHITVDCDPEQIFKTAAKHLTAMEGEDKAEADKALKALVGNQDALMTLGLETHYPLAETVSERYRSLAIELARRIEAEYDCKTPSEKMLAEMIAGGYVRSIEYSKNFNNSTRIDFLSTIKTGYYMMMSKEVDRAQRQMLSALATLKQIKSPTFEINVKAKNAFVAQNQQINNPLTDETNNFPTNRDKTRGNQAPAN